MKTSNNEPEKFSYSKLDTFEQCPYRFKKKYEEKKRSFKGSIATDIGSILHKGKELVGMALIEDKVPNYEDIANIVLNGYDEEYTTKNGEQKTKHIKGINEIEEEYFEDWSEPDNKSGMDYNQKIEIYFSHLKDLAKENNWKPIATEEEFNFPFRDYILNGFIDRIDQNEDGNYRVVDYKSSKATYDDKKIKTPLQMFIYALAVENKFDELPIEFVYDFILLDKQQKACSQGYYKRGLRKLNRLFDDIEECRATGIYTPKPSPLCHWCEYCNTNSQADNKYKDECPYYSLWTPTNKTYEVNKEFNPKLANEIEEFDW